MVFTLGFPIIMILIFGSIFNGEIGDGVKFTQYFVTGMIATGLMTAGFQNLAIRIPIERDRGVLKRFRGTPMPKWVYFAGKVIMVVVDRRRRDRVCCSPSRSRCSTWSCPTTAASG